MEMAVTILVLGFLSVSGKRVVKDKTAAWLTASPPIFYNLSNEEQRILMGFSSKESIDGLIAALQHVRSVYYPPKLERKLEDTQQFNIDSLK